jgi:beta-lactamase class A
MNHLILFLTLLTTALSFSCGYITTGQPDIAPRPAPEPAPAPSFRSPEPLNEKIDRDLQNEIAKIAEDAKGKVGVGAVMLETGDTVWLDRGGQFPSQSVYKLPIAMAVMRMVDEGETRLDADVIIRPSDFVRRGFHSPIRNLNPQGTVLPLTEVVRYSISESDGTASDVLLDLAGGPSAVQKYLADIGIKDFIVADSEKSISKDWETQYRNWATPDASIQLLRALHERRAGLSELTTTLLLTDMTESETGHRRIKRGLPEGATLAHKTGTGGTEAEVPNVRTGSGSDRVSPVASSNSPKESTTKPTPTPTRKTKATPTPDARVTSATNDIGIITLPDGRHILIAIYIQDSAADTWEREKVMADIAKATCEKWTNVVNVKIGDGHEKSNCTNPQTSEIRDLCDAIVKSYKETDPDMIDALDFYSERIDLNEDGERETVVWAYGQLWGGSSGYGTIVLQRVQGRLRKLFSDEMTWTPILALNSKTNGWRDLAFVRAGGGAETNFVIIRHNGKVYHTAETRKAQPEGRVLIGKNWNQSVFGPIQIN